MSFSQHDCRLVFNCFQAGEETYDPQHHTAEKAIEDAVSIYDKGQAKFLGTDEKGIFKILCAAPPEHVKNIDQAYSDKYGYTLIKAMEKELSGNVRDATLHLIGMKTKPFEASAAMIKTACKGIGTDELVSNLLCFYSSLYWLKASTYNVISVDTAVELLHCPIPICLERCHGVSLTVKNECVLSSSLSHLISSYDLVHISRRMERPFTIVFAVNAVEIIWKRSLL